MPRLAEELRAIEVSRLTAEGFYSVGRVPGLYLSVARTGARSWILRTMVGNKRRDIGLGPYPAVTLAMAHEKAQRTRETIQRGIDPIAQKRELRASLIAEQVRELTFEQCATRYLDITRNQWKNPKHAKQWQSTLETYAYPVIGTMPVKHVSREHVLKILEPIWKDKTETASRLRGRIENVFSWAIETKLYPGLNPARLKDNLEKSLPKRSKVATVKHHAALNRDAMQGFISAVRLVGGVGSKALEFLIYTAARSGEVRGATWAEIDFKASTWTIPKERMKSGREHRVPLSTEAVKLLKPLPKGLDSPYVFTSLTGKQLSDMTLSAVMRRMAVDAVPHGFRSTFKDWASETTDYPNALSEMALAHTIGNDVEAAYRRGDMFEKRRAMMEDWAAFCASTLSKKTASNRKAQPPKLKNDRA